MDILSHGYSTASTAGQTAPDVARLRERSSVGLSWAVTCSTTLA
jgi:hypothetical protein